MSVHKPVLVKEVLEYLDPKSNESFIDATVGEGGHALLILQKTGPLGRLLGVDLDQDQIRSSMVNLKDYIERVVLVNDSYASIGDIVQRTRFQPINGILLDLGFSSRHMESAKGFSFQKNERLDMRYSKKSELTAEKIINEFSEKDLEEILREFGEEKFSKQIARKIIQARKVKKIKTTFELLDIIENAIPTFARGKRRGLSNWAKAQVGVRSFQALRIAVNRELENLATFLPQAFSILQPRGRLVVISFHSLEDRTVKNFFRDQKEFIEILTKKPVGTSNREIAENPRARSAKLRAIIKR